MCLIFTFSKIQMGSSSNLRDRNFSQDIQETMDYMDIYIIHILTKFLSILNMSESNIIFYPWALGYETKPHVSFFVWTKIFVFILFIFGPPISDMNRSFATVVCVLARELASVGAFTCHSLDRVD